MSNFTSKGKEHLQNDNMHVFLNQANNMCYCMFMKYVETNTYYQLTAENKTRILLFCFSAFTVCRKTRS